MSTTQTVQQHENVSAIENAPLSTSEIFEEVDRQNEACNFYESRDVEPEMESAIAVQEENVVQPEMVPVSDAQNEPSKPMNLALPESVSFRTKSPDEFKAVIQGISTFYDDATLEFTADGMSFRAMDPSHIALIDTFVPKEAFEQYDCQGNTVKVGFVAKDMLRAIKGMTGKKTDNLSFKFSKEEGDKIFLANSDRDMTAKVFTTEVSASSTPLPKLRYDSKVVISNERLASVIKSLGGMHAVVTLTSTLNEVSFSDKNDLGESMIKLRDGQDVEVEAKEDSKASYSLEYLSKIHTALKTVEAEKVTLEYSSRMPLRAEYKIADYGKFHFYIAPRVQD